MNGVQTKFVDLVAYAIRGKKVEQSQLENINWNKLLEYADSHHVKALIYPAILNKENLKGLNKERFQQWKKETISTAINQLQHLRQIEYVLDKFNEVKIPVIVLKGLIIRDFYPRPELRTMCDADILVKKSDLEQAKKLMKSLNYNEGESSPVHISFYNKNCNHIEIHWTIYDKRFFKEKTDLENDMWHYAEKVKIGESGVLAFSPEDMAIHLCIHMAVHILTSGFGIRQLCDLVLLIEKNKESINWFSFCEKGRKWGIEKFITVIFMICNKLFKMFIPEEIQKNSINIDSSLIKWLTDDILDGGVYGRKDLSYVFANEFAYNSEEAEGGNTIDIIKRFLKLLFPPIINLSDRYNYAKKNKVLLPFAWIHHIVSGIMNNKYIFKEKVDFLKYSVFISSKRHSLLKKLDL